MNFSRALRPCLASGGARPGELIDSADLRSWRRASRTRRGRPRAQHRLGFVVAQRGAGETEQDTRARRLVRRLELLPRRPGAPERATRAAGVPLGGATPLCLRSHRDEHLARLPRRDLLELVHWQLRAARGLRRPGRSRPGGEECRASVHAPLSSRARRMAAAAVSSFPWPRRSSASPGAARDRSGPTPCRLLSLADSLAVDATRLRDTPLDQGSLVQNARQSVQPRGRAPSSAAGHAPASVISSARWTRQTP